MHGFEQEHGYDKLNRELTAEEKAFLDDRLTRARLAHRMSGPDARTRDDSLIDEAIEDIVKYLRRVKLRVRYMHASPMALLLLGRTRALQSQGTLTYIPHFKWADDTTGVPDDFGIQAKVKTELDDFLHQALSSGKRAYVEKALQAVLDVCRRGGVNTYTTPIKHGTVTHKETVNLFDEVQGKPKLIYLVFPANGQVYPTFIGSQYFLKR